MGGTPPIPRGDTKRCHLDHLGTREENGPAGFPGALTGEIIMRRHHVNKHKSAKTFRKNVAKTKYANMRGAPMRGGIRM